MIPATLGSSDVITVVPVEVFDGDGGSGRERNMRDM